MKKELFFLFLLSLFNVFQSQSQISDLIISEYGEGSSGNAKYIEIYNGTGAIVNLANYTLWRVTNGGTWPEATLPLSGSLADGSTYVIANNTADTPGADLYNSSFCSWNGDDAVGLASAGVLIDGIGTDGTDPGTHWTVGTSGETRNDRLTRKSTICSPNANWSSSSGTTDANSEWTYAAYTNGSANAGHITTCSSCTPPADPSGTIAGDATACNDTDLTYNFDASEPVGGIDYYWQTSATGTDTSNNANVTLNVTSNGSYYVRAYNSASTCWSDNAVGPFNVNINTAPTITSQPDDSIVNVGDTTTFVITDTSGTTYQWEESLDSTNWSNTGTNSNTLTIVNAQTNISGNFYRVTISNSCGSVVSDIVQIFVFDSTCIDEDFASFADWTNNGTVTDSDITHYGNASPCRAFSNGDAMISPDVDYPEFLIFYQDASNGGNGSTASVEYRIGTGTWQALSSFQVTTSGNVETINLTNVSGVDLSNETDVSFRFNSSFNSWYLDDVVVYCTTCNSPTITTSILPDSGPIGTEITISGSDFTVNTTVDFNGVNATIISQTATQLIVSVPTNATDGTININTPTICSSSLSFDVIDQEIDCQTSLSPNNPSDLFIYEVFDEDQNANGPPVDYGNGGMITIFNGTLETKNLSEYRIYRSSDYNTNPYNLWFSPSGTLAPGELYRIRVTGSLCTGYTSPYEDVVIGFNSDDGIELRKDDGTGNFNTIDQVYTPSYVGYYYLRDLTVANPNATYDSNDWTITDIYDPPSNTTTCVNVGITPTFVGNTPDVSISNPSSVCNNATIQANLTEGYNGTSPSDNSQLNVEWYYNDGNTNTWNLISSGGDFTINNSIDDAAGTGISELLIENLNDKINFQFYCRVQEDNSDCYKASEAITLNIQRAIWDGTNWSTLPNINTIAVIDGDYDTAIGTNSQTSFDACSLVINAGNEVIVRNGDYIRVVNDVLVNGLTTDDSPNVFYELTIETQGAFVQDGIGSSAGNFTLANGANSRVLKTTSVFDSTTGDTFYTYWSSPVVNPGNVETVFPNAFGNRRYYFEASNFVDSEVETNNNNGAVLGQDDIDDNGNDWQIANGVSMEVGRGYAVTAAFPPPMPGNFTDNAAFNGALNTGDQSITIFKNNEEISDNNWNFIGNPYPSAIGAQEFLDTNTNIDGNPTGLGGALFFWSQVSLPESTNNGNEAINFSQSDYAIMNGVSGVAGGATTTPPSPYIPSGQGFFVSYKEDLASSSNTVSSIQVVFNNDMRETSNNDQFFNPEGDQTKSNQNNLINNTLWLNLNSDNGVFSQLSVVYTSNATDEYDGWYFDTPRNYSTKPNASIETIIIDSDKNFAIQAKNDESLTIEEIIDVTFQTVISVPTIYTISIDNFEGTFFSENAIYLYDTYNESYQNLKENSYNFTSDAGNFSDRFKIVFSLETLSNTDIYISNNNLQIIDLNHSDVKFKLNSSHLIETITITDLQGRIVYKFEDLNNAELILDLHNLSQTTYMASVVLDNGIVLHKKAIKR